MPMAYLGLPSGMSKETYFSVPFSSFPFLTGQPPKLYPSNPIFKSSWAQYFLNFLYSPPCTIANIKGLFFMLFVSLSNSFLHLFAQIIVLSTAFFCSCCDREASVQSSRHMTISDFIFNCS